jgi:type III secretion protein Q
MSSSFVPRTVAREVFAYRNLLSRHRRPMTLNWLGADWRLRLEALEPGRGPGHDIEFDWGGARAVLRADAGWLDRVASERIGCAIAPGTPDLLLKAMLEAALGEAGTRIEHATRKKLRLVSAGETPADLDGMEGFSWQMEGEGPHFCGELWVDVLGLGFLAAALRPWTLGAPQDSLADALPVTLRFEIGWAELDCGDLAQIGAGDVLMFDECWLQAQNSLAVRVGNQALRCVLDGSRLVVTEGWRKTMDDVQDRPRGDEDEDEDPDFDGELDDEGDEDEEEPGRREAMRAAGEAFSVDAIPVRLGFELGERTVELGELRSITVGHVFELGRDLRRAVTIRANGKPIGIGELVNVDGQLGVSILEIAFSSPR